MENRRSFQKNANDGKRISRANIKVIFVPSCCVTVASTTRIIGVLVHTHAISQAARDRFRLSNKMAEARRYLQRLSVKIMDIRLLQTAPLETPPRPFWTIKVRMKNPDPRNRKISAGLFSTVTLREHLGFPQTYVAPRSDKCFIQTSDVKERYCSCCLLNNLGGRTAE